MDTPASVLQRLQSREQAGNLRQLPKGAPLVDFSSNDYLGFSTTGILKERIEALREEDSPRIGATGSRLISGNSEFLETLEGEIAAFHGAPAALIFNSGYDANIGVLSSLATRHDTIIYDELSHASIIDGARLALAKNCWSFIHNDIEDLRSKLHRASGAIYVVAESIYSMDGDFAPLAEIASLCKEFGAYLIIDEAHATGIFGDQGKGRVSELGLEEDVFARIHTFSKALGTHGAVVLGSVDLRNFLINFARSFIYSTALDIPNQYAIKAAYSILRSKEFSPVNLFMLVHEFRQAASKNFGEAAFVTFSPIQAIRFPGNQNAQKAAAHARSKGFDVKAILSPTVPEGSERLRICLHTFNAPPEVQALLHALTEVR